jgi:hypothetical protein
MQCVSGQVTAVPGFAKRTCELARTTTSQGWTAVGAKLAGSCEWTLELLITDAGGYKPVGDRQTYRSLRKCD